MDQVYFYVGQALYYGILAAFWVSYVMMLGYFLWHKQWLFVFLSLVFTAGFYAVGPFILLGPLIVLIVGWQEAAKWNIKKLVRISSALLVISFLLMTRTWYLRPKESEKKVDKVAEGRMRAQKAAAAAAAKKN